MPGIADEFTPTAQGRQLSVARGAGIPTPGPQGFPVKSDMITNDNSHMKSTRASMADQTVAAIAVAPRPEASSTFTQIAVHAALAATGTLATNVLLPSLPEMAASLNLSSGGHVSHHHFPCGVRHRPARGRADLGSLRPALAGADGLCGVPRRQYLVRTGQRSAEPADRPRHPGHRRMRDLGAVARDCQRSLRRPGACARHGPDHDRDGSGARILAAARSIIILAGAPNSPSSDCSRR